ncbi:MAG: hypothetical protein ACYTEO_19365, partial [Planctomycetota bacterium]
MMKCLILILIVLLPVSVLADAFGIEANHTLSGDVRDAIIGSPYTANGSGTIDSISVYINTSGSGCSVSVAIYLVSAANDTVLVDSSEHLGISTGTNWYDLNMQMGGSVYQDSIYYLCARAYD